MKQHIIRPFLSINVQFGSAKLPLWLLVAQDGHRAPDWCKIGGRTTVREAQAGWGTDCLQPAAAKDTSRELAVPDNHTAERSQHLRLEDKKELEDTRMQELEGSQVEADNLAAADSLAAEDSLAEEGSQAVVGNHQPVEGIRQPEEGNHRQNQLEKGMARMW